MKSMPYPLILFNHVIQLKRLRKNCLKCIIWPNCLDLFMCLFICMIYYIKSRTVCEFTHFIFCFVYSNSMSLIFSRELTILNSGFIFFFHVWWFIMICTKNISVFTRWTKVFFLLLFFLLLLTCLLFRSVLINENKNTKT
jgi:hypothetical protein